MEGKIKNCVCKQEDTVEKDVKKSRPFFVNFASCVKEIISKFMYMKKSFVLCFLAIMFGCKQEDMVDTEKFRLWCVSPISTIDDSKVHLIWGTMCYDKMLRPYEFVAPDEIDIYIAQNEMSNFQKIIEVDNNGSYTVDKLQNGKPYFFYFVSKKKGFKPLFSDTIMAVPNSRNNFEILQKCEEEHVPSLSNVSIAHKKNKIAYVDKYYYWNGGSNCCMAVSILIANMDGSEKELVKINGYHPSWSPANDKVAFHYDDTYTYVNNVGWISQIALFDYETKSISQLTNDNSIKYSPVFSKNGELLLFQSSKYIPYSPGMDATNIWLLNLKTLESFQITDISKTSLRTVERPCWIDNDRFLFHGAYSERKNPYQLFESSVSKKQITKIFESKWNDYNPSVSPDQAKIAFISNRSGMNQVWIYHIYKKTFSQITGYSNNESLSYEWSNIEWLDNSTIVFTINENQLVKQIIE